MTALAELLAGGRLTAALIQGVAPNAVVKGADESVTSSTALQNDDALFLPLQADSVWFFASAIFYTGDTTSISTGGLKFGFVVPAGASLASMQLYLTTTSLTATLSGPGSGSGQTRNAVTDGTGTEVPALVVGTVIMGATAGNLQLEWAQAFSDATATTVKTGSLLAAWQVQ